MTQTRIHAEKKKRVTKETEAAALKKAKDQQALKDDLDALLTDVDEALQGISTDFAVKYEQKGGE